MLWMSNKREQDSFTEDVELKKSFDKENMFSGFGNNNLGEVMEGGRMP